MPHERFKRIFATQGADAALGAPVAEPQSDPIEDLLDSNNTARKQDTQNTVALAALTFGDLLYDVASVDPRVLAAADFSRSADLSDVFKFSFFADGIGSMSDAGASGATASLQGYVAEQVVAMRLMEQGYQVSLPEHANEPGVDLFVDGHPFQVKCLGDLGGIRAHFADYPDVPVIANAELAETIGQSNADWADKVFFVDGFDQEHVEELTDSTIEAGAEILDFEIPLFAGIISGVRGLHGWWRGDLGLNDAIADVVANVATKGALGGTGGLVGVAAGTMIFGPAGGVVFGGVSAVAAASQSRRILDQFKSAAAAARDAVLAQTTEELLNATLDGLKAKLEILRAKRSKVGGPGPVSSYLRGRFEDDIAHFQERLNEAVVLAKNMDHNIVEHALKVIDLVRRSKVHPVGLQGALKRFLEAFEQLQAASNRWF